MTDDVATRIVTALSPSETARAVAIIDAATKADGQPPLSEHVLFHVRAGGNEHSVHILATHDGELAGCGHLGPALGHQPAVLELAVDPAHRRHGIARAIVEAAQAHTGGPLQLWAHGGAGTSAALATSLGFVKARSIWQMRRLLAEPLPEVPLPDGFALRTFLPGIDDAEWLAVNARAFAGHPEQGEWTLADLHQRMAEPWFSASGFLIAEETATGRIAGFHWTKVHDEHDEHHADDGHHNGHPHGAVGEVYVVGVDPAFHGRGLGKALTVAGLAHLRGLGLTEALLYVDESNTTAIAMYAALGFARADIDVLYAAP